MTQFKYHNAGNSQAQEQEALAYLLEQSSLGVAATGVLTGLSVTQTSTASSSVLVNIGACVVQGSLTAGAALLINDATNTEPVLTGGNVMGSLPRNDIVVFNSLTSQIEVVFGTANATPTDPTVANTSIKLARLRETANATTITNSQIDDLRTYTQLGPVPSLVRIVAPTASGTLASTANLAPTQSLPAKPFGPGVPYVVHVDTSCTAVCPANSGLILNVTIDSTQIVSDTQTNAGNSSCTMQAMASTNYVISDDNAHTVGVVIGTTGAADTISASSSSRWFHIILTPALTF